jgi:hypothetical protein
MEFEVHAVESNRKFRAGCCVGTGRTLVIACPVMLHILRQRVVTTHVQDINPSLMK